MNNLNQPQNQPSKNNPAPGGRHRDSEPASRQEKLHRMARQAKQALADQEPERERLKQQGQEIRVKRRRIIIWLIELIVLLTLVEIFILAPRRLAREARQREIAENALSPGQGEELTALGDQARELAGLQEVVPAYAASLDMLAAGSETAQSQQIAFAQDMRLPVEVENTIGMRFRLVPPGSFNMGSPQDEPGRWEGEARHQAVIHQPVYFGRYEVTQEQWRQVMGTAPSRFTGPNRPVESITWEEARRFTEKLAELEGLPIGTYRLPSEKEWEYACRAGTTTAYVFGDNPALLGHFAAYAGNGGRQTNVVGRFRPNAYGIHDMHGNVWEWCRDLFRNYPGVDLPDITDGQYYNVRGGNWNERALDCRSAIRTRLPPRSLGNMLGLRVIRVIPELIM